MYTQYRLKKNKINQKATALAISVVFLFNFLLNGLSVAQPVQINQALNTESATLDLSSFNLPLSLGYVRESYDSKQDKPTVIYIQDAHCNYTCQKSIIGIVGHIQANYGVDFAAIEGGAGNYDFSIFTSIPDMQLREKVLDYFIKQGRVTGVEAFASLNPNKITVKGLEQPALYEKNLQVYRESLGYREAVDKYLDILRHYINNLKPPIFTEQVTEFDDRKQEYDDNKNKLKDYILYLWNISSDKKLDLQQFSNLSKLLNLMKEEDKINFKQADREKEYLIDHLTGKLSRIEIATLVRRSIEFKEKNVSPADFYGYIFKLAKSSRINMKQYPELVKYKAYLDKYDQVEKDVFFEEIFDAEKFVADNLFSSPDEKRLYYLSNDLYILNNLFEISMTRRVYDYYISKENELSAGEFVRFIKEKASWYNLPTDINPDVEQLDVYRKRISDFYKYSFERDEVFIENINKYSKDKQALFMVTGGFHTDSMIEHLKENGYSYILITPKIESEKDNPYFHLLSGGLSPVEGILSEYTAALALRSPFSQMGEVDVRNYVAVETNRLTEFIPAMENLGASYGLPHELEPAVGPGSGVFLTLSTRNREDIMEELQRALPQEQFDRAVIVDVQPAGSVGERRVYAIVHSDESLFEPLMPGEEAVLEAMQAQRPAVEEPIQSAQAVASAQAMAELAPIRAVADQTRQDTYNGVLVGVGGYGDVSAMANVASDITRQFNDKFGADSNYVTAYRAVGDNIEAGFKAEVKKHLDRLVGQGANRLPHLTIHAPGSEGVTWVEEVMTGYDNIPTGSVHIINTRMPAGHRTNAVSLVVHANGIHNIKRYQAGNYGDIAPDLVTGLIRINMALLATLVTNPPETIAQYMEIINNLQPIQLIGISEKISAWKVRQKELARSL